MSAKRWRKPRAPQKPPERAELASGSALTMLREAMQTVREKEPAPKTGTPRPSNRWRNWLFYIHRVEGEPKSPGYVPAENVWPSKDLAEMSWLCFERRNCLWMAQNGVLYAGARPEE